MSLNLRQIRYTLSIVKLGVCVCVCEPDLRTASHSSLIYPFGKGNIFDHLLG